MKATYVVIPSGSPDNLRRCLKTLSVIESKFDWSRLVVIADSYDPSPILDGRGSHAITQKPFSVSRNINLGISMCPADSQIFLCGDDIEFVTGGGLSTLAKKGDEPKIGAVSAAVIGNCSPYQNYKRLQSESTGLLRAPCTDPFTTVNFTAVLITRQLINSIGIFDESLIGYACEDTDYCYRADQAGYWVGTASCLVVKHLNGSVFRKDRAAWAIMHHAARERLDAKWKR